MKKPLNQIEVPAYPDIKKGPPRFVWSRKHWVADPGAVMRDAEPFTQFYENAVLVQSRNYNETQYGKSSHKDVVNAEFRPPLISPYEDNYAITRIPCTIHAIVPHINPTTADDTGGTTSYQAKNQRPSDIEGALTDRLKDATWRPTFYAPMDAPVDNSVLPDLDITMPSISVQSGWEIPYNSGLAGVNPVIPLREQIFTTPLQTAPQPPVLINGENKNIENFTLISTLPSYSASSGANPTYKTTIYNENVKLGTTSGFTTPFSSGTNSTFYLDGDVEYISELSKTLPNYSTTAGSNVSYTSHFEDHTPNLNRKQPSYSMTSFSSTEYTNTSPNPEIHLEYNRPQVSVTSGGDTNFSSHFEERSYDLQSKLDSMPISVINPGSEFGYFENNESVQTLENKVRQNKPNYSYYIPQEVPTYREKNEMTHTPSFIEKLQAEKSYGSIAQSGGFIPRFGVDMPRTDFGGKGNAVKRMGYVKAKPKYRI